MKLSTIAGVTPGGGGSGGGYTLRTGNTFASFSDGFGIGVANNVPVSCSANVWTTMVNQSGPGVVTFLRLSSTDPNTVVHDIRIIIDGVQMLTGTFTIANFTITPITANQASTGAAPIPIKFETSFLVEYRSTKSHTVNVSRQILLTT